MKEEFGKVTLNKLITEGAPNPEEIAKIQQQRALEEAQNKKKVKIKICFN